MIERKKLNSEAISKFYNKLVKAAKQKQPADQADHIKHNLPVRHTALPKESQPRPEHHATRHSPPGQVAEAPIDETDEVESHAEQNASKSMVTTAYLNHLIQGVRLNLHRNPSRARQELDELAEKIKDFTITSADVAHAAHQKMLVERLNSRLEDLEDKYERIIGRKEKEITLLEERFRLMTRKKEEVTTIDILRERIDLIKSKLNMIKRKGQLTNEQFTRLDTKISKILVSLSAPLPKTETKDAISKLRAPRPEASEPEQETQSNEQQDMDGNREDNDENSQEDNENPPQDEASDSQAEEDDGSLPVTSGDSGASASQDDEQRDIQANQAKVSSSKPIPEMDLPEEEHAPPDWLSAEYEKEPPIPMELKPLEVPPVEQHESTFTPLPEMDSDEIDVPLTDGQKKKTLADRLKGMFGK